MAERKQQTSDAALDYLWEFLCKLLLAQYIDTQSDSVQRGCVLSLMPYKISAKLQLKNKSLYS